MYAISTKNYENGNIVQEIYYDISGGVTTLNDKDGNLTKVMIESNSRTIEFRATDKTSNIVSTEIEVFNKRTDKKICRSFLLERQK